MGILLVSKNSDFSANPVGHAGLYTSITDGLQSLFETRRSASKATNNSAPGGASGSVIGAPTFSAASTNVGPANTVLFGSKPTSGGLSMAVIVKMKNGGVANDGVAGVSLSGAAATNGSVLFSLYNRQLSFQGYSYAAGSVPPLSGYTALVARQNFLADSDGVFELFFGVLENNVSVRLYHPKTTTLTTNPAVGRDFAFNAPPLFSTAAQNTGYTQDVAMFAHWSGVKTPAEMNTFYSEMQSQYAKLGLVI